MNPETPNNLKIKNTKRHRGRPQVKKCLENKIYLELKNIKNYIFEKFKAQK